MLPVVEYKVNLLQKTKQIKLFKQFGLNSCFQVILQKLFYKRSN